jgi:hypothetical protein
MLITDKRHHAPVSPEEAATVLMQELAYNAIEMGYFFPRKGKHSKPGEVIQHLTPEKRDLLKHLSSEHFAEGELPGLALVGDVSVL